MIEPHPTPPDLLVLHTLRCIGFASVQRVEAALAGLTDADVEEELLSLAAQGLVTHERGEFGGWGLTDAGKAADTERIGDELDVAGGRGEVQVAYVDFLDLNPRALDLCGAWQVRGVDGSVVLNDHTDAEYDNSVLARLADLDAEAQHVCARLGARLQRFSRYGPRLARALERAGAGDVAQITDSLDSYHTVWFQLHEDLLATLGIARDA
ncbi:transcriptional regulator [Egicoccus sp. AB-alg2]|uniref:transcriptional regulator n=1 Tax=Egicoccus sp. AB-alg2 TaxID=3242693 RepID=UPI00359E2150